MARKAAKPTSPTITAQLKQAIANSGLMTYALAKETGIAQPILHRFIAGERDLRLAMNGRPPGRLPAAVIEAGPMMASVADRHVGAVAALRPAGVDALQWWLGVQNPNRLAKLRGSLRAQTKGWTLMADTTLAIPAFPGWRLLGAFPDGEPDDVGSWLLHHRGEAALLEIPPGLTPRVVSAGLQLIGCSLKLASASHGHEDHFDRDAWRSLRLEFPQATFLHPKSIRGDQCLTLGGEPLWLIKAPKHSKTDVVVVFRGVAMTGDIELGTLTSVNREVPKATKAASMAWLRGFEERHNYHVQTVVSAHLNDLRMNVDWSALFAVAAT